MQNLRRSGTLKELSNKVNKPLGNSQSGGGRLQNLLIRGVWVKVKTGFHSVRRNWSWLPK